MELRDINCGGHVKLLSYSNPATVKLKKAAIINPCRRITLQKAILCMPTAFQQESISRIE